jgi:hypothetical protein
VSWRLLLSLIRLIGTGREGRSVNGTLVKLSRDDEGPEERENE